MKRYAGALLGFLLAGCATVAQIDPGDKYHSQQEVAEQLTDAINLLPDELEHGAFIYCVYRDKCYPSDIVTGEHSSIPWKAIDTIRIDEHNSYAFIHSHPKSIKSAGSFVGEMIDIINQYPSIADFDFGFHERKNGGVGHPFTMYIIGPDDVLREFILPSNRDYLPPAEEKE